MAKSKKKTKTKQKKSFLSLPNNYNRLSVVVFALIFVAIGAFIIFHSHAASNNVNDEVAQYYDINQLRASVGRPALQPSACLEQAARSWSQHVAGLPGTPQQKMTNPAIYHHSLSALTTLVRGCGSLAGANGENFGVQATSLTVAGVPNPAQGIFNSMQPPNDTTCCQNDHYNNMINSSYNYLGVGSYRDDSGYLWITEEFMQCTGSCPLARAYAIAPSSYWTLTGKVSVSNCLPACKALDINVHAGATVAWSQDIVNDGPVTATYQEHINAYHLSPSGAVLSTVQAQSGSVSTPAGTVWSLGSQQTIPSTAQVGERFCREVYYTNASGPGTAATIQPVPKSCVTVH